VIPLLDLATAALPRFPLALTAGHFAATGLALDVRTVLARVAVSTGICTRNSARRRRRCAR